MEIKSTLKIYKKGESGLFYISTKYRDEINQIRGEQIIVKCLDFIEPIAYAVTVHISKAWNNESYSFKIPKKTLKVIVDSKPDLKESYSLQIIRFSEI